MRLRQLTLAWLTALCLAVHAANTKTTVEQVTEAVQLTTNVDYIVTSTTPFTTAGSVDITNTEHAVLIFSGIKPSKVLSSWLKYVYINGSKAVDGTNCQVKMYGRGAIVFPYSKDIQPLTCYTEKNFGGTPCSNYSEGHSGGYMKTLSTDQLNNKIRSFKLKRGYMVTFAIGTAGWGYSRCFIADQEDLEVSTLPTILDQRISSYRIFKWFNAHKAGIGDSNDLNAINALNISWCYRMWPDPQGIDYRPDCEYVPHHYKENYPTYGSLGNTEFSCHIKGNNEPGNSADEAPCDVDAVLANWQDAMRTGMRLLSESSHDGSMGHLKSFIEAIDARGWRCDILDLHCYWDGGFDNLNWYSDYYGNGRPIWISEWIWGASWNHNGAFGNNVTDQRILERTTEILNTLNASTRVERYAYWNSESKAKIYNNGVTTLGEHYGTMDVGQGYNATAQYIPTNPPLQSIGELAYTYNYKNGDVKLTWSDPNGELMEKFVIMRKAPGESTYSTVSTIPHKEQNTYPNGSASYTFNETVTEPGVYLYYFKAYSHDSKTFDSNTVTVNVAPSQGTNKYQYGKLSVNTTSPIVTNYSETMEATSANLCVFMGPMTRNNTDLQAGNRTQPSGTGTTNTTSAFTYTLLPWHSNTAVLNQNEEIPFLVLPIGNYRYGDLDCEVGSVKSEKSTTDTWSDVTQVTFTQPFPEGVTPIVLTEIKNPSLSTYTSLGTRVFDVTNNGFKFIIYTEDGTTMGSSTSPTLTKVTTGQIVRYLAITPGIGTLDPENNIIIAAGHGTDNPIYSGNLKSNKFQIEQYDEVTGKIQQEQLYLYSPTILAALQTNNYPTLCTLRRRDMTTTIDGVKWTTGIGAMRTLDHDITVDGKTIPRNATQADYAPYRDQLGWVAIAHYKEGGSAPTAIQTVPYHGNIPHPRIVDRRIQMDGVQQFELYNTAGAKMDANSQQAPGIYVVKANGKSVKVLIK